MLSTRVSTTDQYVITGIEHSTLTPSAIHKMAVMCVSSARMYKQGSVDTGGIMSETMGVCTPTGVCHTCGLRVLQV
jgi:hypothetical protein